MSTRAKGSMCSPFLAISLEARQATPQRPSSTRHNVVLQEPDSNREIQKFVRSMYKVKFPILAKVDVNGADAHPLFKHLTAATINRVPKAGWNPGTPDKDVQVHNMVHLSCCAHCYIEVFVVLPVLMVFAVELHKVSAC